MVPPLKKKQETMSLKSTEKDVDFNQFTYYVAKLRFIAHSKKQTFSSRKTILRPKYLLRNVSCVHVSKYSELVAFFP